MGGMGEPRDGMGRSGGMGETCDGMGRMGGVGGIGEACAHGVLRIVDGTFGLECTGGIDGIGGSDGVDDIESIGAVISGPCPCICCCMGMDHCCAIAWSAWSVFTVGCTPPACIAS